MVTIHNTALALFFLIATTVHGAKKGFSDTTNGFNWFLVFDTPILMANVSIDATPYDIVWGASDRIVPMYRASNPNIVLALYIPWARDNDPTQDISYWKAFHPDWVLYKCDKVTPAYGVGDPHVPLDVSNPDVIEWQLTKYVNMTKVFGYDGIAADNFALGNSNSGCGIWKDGVWVQKYNGGWNDATYTYDAMNWLQTFYTKLQQQAPDVSFGINFSLNGASPTDPTVLAVTDHVDYIMDEAGYTNWGFGLPPPQAWDDISTWIINIQSKGKHYFGINEFTTLTPQAKEFGMASYLMSKNDHSSMICTTVQGYGSETKMPEYDTLNVGTPLGPRTSSNGLFIRKYSNGLALVNPNNNSVSYSLPNDGVTYHDVLGNVYKPAQSVSVSGQTGVVMGVQSRVTTTTTATTATTATSSTTSASGPATSSASTSSARSSAAPSATSSATSAASSLATSSATGVESGTAFASASSATSSASSTTVTILSATITAAATLASTLSSSSSNNDVTTSSSGRVSSGTPIVGDSTTSNQGTTLSSPSSTLYNPTTNNPSSTTSKPSASPSSSPSTTINPSMLSSTSSTSNPSSATSNPSTSSTASSTTTSTSSTVLTPSTTSTTTPSATTSATTAATTSTTSTATSTTPSPSPSPSPTTPRPTPSPPSMPPSEESSTSSAAPLYPLQYLFTLFTSFAVITLAFL